MWPRERVEPTVASTSVSTSPPSGAGCIMAGMAEVDDDTAKSYELAFEEAARALDAQERAVNELRSRAGVLIAAAAITTSFFGSRAITGHQLSTWVWVAVAAFIVGWLFSVFRTGLIVLVAEVAAWMVALAERA